MGNIDIKWFIEGRIAYIETSGEITLDDMLVLNQRIVEFMEKGLASGASLVHFIIDDTRVTDTKVKINDLSQLLQVIRDPSFGWAVFIGHENPMVKMLVYLVAQIARIRYRRFSTHADAIKFLQAQAKDINWSLADSTFFEASEQAGQ